MTIVRGKSNNVPVLSKIAVHAVLLVRKNKAAFFLFGLFFTHSLTRKWKYVDFEVHTFVSKIGLKSHEN